MLSDLYDFLGNFGWLVSEILVDISKRSLVGELCVIFSLSFLGYLRIMASWPLGFSECPKSLGIMGVFMAATLILVLSCTIIVESCTYHLTFQF